LSTNYFDLFGLEHRLNLDLKDLEQRFYLLSRKLHPDMAFRRTPLEQQEALDLSAVLNDAYRTLKEPVARAEYLLKEQGFDIGEQKSGDVPPELLEEVFELNMALEEADRPQMENARSRFASMLEAVDRELEQKFAEFDRVGEHGVLSEIRGILNRRKYVGNLVKQVEKELERAQES